MADASKPQLEGTIIRVVGAHPADYNRPFGGVPRDLASRTQRETSSLRVSRMSSQMLASELSLPVEPGKASPADLVRRTLLQEATALARMISNLSAGQISRAVEAIVGCSGNICLVGLGKAGLIARKIAATLTSTGTPSYFLHPSEALHGDLGILRQNDIIMSLSASGETEETIQAVRQGKRQGSFVIAITCRPGSSLGQLADCVLGLGEVPEAGMLGLAPTCSTTCMLAVGDALALAVSELRGFSARDFARFHPGGTLGLQLAAVDDWMRPLKQCRLAKIGDSVRAVVVATSCPGRRTGAIMLVDHAGCLRGIFTDSDLARLFEHRHEAGLDRLIEEVMTTSPKHVLSGEKLIEAVQILVQFKLSELPVVNRNLQPVGLLDITDVLPLVPGDHPLQEEV